MNLRARFFAAIAALFAFLLDIAVELILQRVPLNGTNLVPGLADLRYAWNRGVSFSLLSQHTMAGNWILSALLAVIVIILLLAAWHTRKNVMAIGFGLIVGGALGNLSDRVLHGAVFDFLYLHAGRMPFFVCNTADIMISLGVLCLANGTLRNHQ